MSSPKAKAQNLLNRFPFTDLAVAVSRKGSARDKFLRAFVDGGTSRSYKWTRDSALLIYGVEQQMFPTPLLDWPRIESVIRTITPEHNVERNVEASELLFNLVRPRRYKAYEHDDQVLRIGLKQVVSIGLRFYIVDGERLVFQFPQPRAQAIFHGDVAITMMSIMYHAYATGDFAAADIEIADLSPEEEHGPRVPRIRRLEREDIVGREELTSQIEQVYEILHALAERKPDDDGPGGLI